jgi:signal transduction histidine kinase
MSAASGADGAPRHRSALRRYGLAVAVTGLATVLKLWFPDVIGHEAPVAIYLGAIMLAAWYGGARPGLLATGLSVLAGSYWFAAPYNSFRVDNAEDLVRILFGAIEGVTISLLAGALHRQIAAREKAESSLQRSNEQLLLAQKMHAIGSLAAGLAHDLNNQLTVVLSFAALARARLPGDSTVRSHVDGIHDAGSRAAELTRRVLSFARARVDEPRVLDLGDVVRDLERMLRIVAGSEIDLSTRLDGAPALLRADPTQMEQLLTNLVVNARDAMPLGGRLTIGVTTVELDAAGASAIGAPPGPYVCLTVTDTGAGMSDEVRARIFEPFFTTKEAGNGSGLGLVIVRGVVDRGGGTVHVETAPGAGTTFTVHLPRVESAKPVSGTGGA